MQEFQEKITLKFDGQNHQVDLAVYTSVLMNYMTIVNTVAEEQGSKVRLLIDATEEGSLDAIIAIATESFGIFNLLKDNAPLIEAITSIVACTTGIFALKKQLKDTKKIEKVEARGDNSVIVVADNITFETSKDVAHIYEHRPDATRKVDEIFKTLSENPEITGIEFRKDEKPIFRAESSDFSDISRSPNFEGEEVRHVSKNADLQVVKPFLGNSKTRKWEFVLDNSRISAPIVDEEFLKKIDKGEVSFKAGTCLNAKIDIEQYWNHECKAWLNRSYTITKVFGIKENLTCEPVALF